MRTEAETLQHAINMGGFLVDASRLEGSGSHDVEWALVADGRMEHVDEVIDGVRQVPLFRITEKGRAWLAEAER